MRHAYKISIKKNSNFSFPYCKAASDEMNIFKHSRLVKTENNDKPLFLRKPTGAGVASQVESAFPC